MNRILKIQETLKTLPTIMRITQEIKIMRLLRELSVNEIIEEIRTFNEILSNLSDSHSDNYVLADDKKTVAEYELFGKWLKKMSETKELKNKYGEYFDDVIDNLTLFYQKIDWGNKWEKIEEMFTEEELEYICISGIFKQTFHGKEYYIMDSWEGDEIVIDGNKIVYEVKYKQIACKENNYQYEYEINSTENKLIDYLNDYVRKTSIPPQALQRT
jgi:hypothetical protein